MRALALLMNFTKIGEHYPHSYQYVPSLSTSLNADQDIDFFLYEEQFLFLIP